MKISVVVPAFNEEKLIGQTLGSIRAASESFATAGWETELIVCDNNSTDATAERAGAEGAKVVFEPINQIARARNTGAAAATGQWLLFVDADSQPGPGLFADVVEAIQSGRYVAGGATIRLDEDNFVFSRMVALWNGVSRLGRLMAGSFIFCDAIAFYEVGGFNEKLFVTEELDLSRRLKRWGRRRGRKIVILRRHPLRTSARKLHLYGHRAHLRFLLRSMLSLGRIHYDREECKIWYDGRR